MDPGKLVLQLLNVDQDSASKIISGISRELRSAVLQRVATEVRANSGVASERRINGLWLLRHACEESLEQVLQTLVACAESPSEPESIRVLALDCMDVLWVNGVLSPESVKPIWQMVRDDPSVKVRCRWIRALAESGTEWSLRQIREAFESHELRPCILYHLERCDSSSVASLFEEFEKFPLSGEERACVQAARKKYEVARIMGRILGAEEEIADSDALELASQGEFALLYKAMLACKVSKDAIGQVQAMQVDRGRLSKTQKKFYDKVKGWSSGSSP